MSRVARIEGAGLGASMLNREGARDAKPSHPSQGCIAKYAKSIHTAKRRKAIAIESG